MEDTNLPQEESALRRSPCLLSNWVEERATASLDNDPGIPDCTGEVQTHRHGHPGILSTQLLRHMADSTNQKDSYSWPGKDSVLQRGKREEMLHRFLYQTFSKKLYEEITLNPKETTAKQSTTHRDYHMDYAPHTPKPSKDHDYRNEQPVTFWTENLHQIPGVSDIRATDTAFKKSSAFSTPISNCLDQPLPYSLDSYPL